MLFTLPANPASCITSPILRLAKGSSPISGCAGDDGTENGIGFKDGELEFLDDGAWARIEPLNRVECRSARSCVALALVELNTGEGIVSASCRQQNVDDNLDRTSPFLSSDIEFCTTKVRTLPEKNQTSTFGGGHREQIACKHIHESLCIGSIGTL